MLACEVCAEACLSMRTQEQVVRVCRDCNEICGLTATFLARDSALGTEMLDLCMIASERCAAVCEATGIEHCLLCAEVCRKCAEECRRAMTGLELIAA